MSVGVYAIVDETMGRIVYIGCSKNIESRWKELRRRFNTKKISSVIREIYQTVGSRGLSFEILEETLIADRFSRERYWIELYEPAGNVTHTARGKELKKLVGQSQRGKKVSSESRERMRIAQQGKKISSQTRENMRQSHQARWDAIKNSEEIPVEELARRQKIREKLIGKPRPKEVVEKFSASLKGREVWNKGIPHSDETKRKISEALRRRKK